MIVKFSDVFSDETKHCQKIPSSEYLPEGSFPIIDQGKEQVAGYSNAGEGLFTEVPAIIFGDHTRIIKYVDEPFLVGADGVKVLKCKIEDTNYKYLYYCLQAIRIPNTGYNRHFKWLKEASVPLPPLDEQRKIAAVLDKVSDLIAKRRQQLTKLDELVKSRFIELFGDPIDNPKAFPVRKLKTLSRKISDGVHAKPQYTETGRPFLSVVNINKGVINFDGCKFVSEEAYQKMIKSTHPERGDVLYTKVGATYGIPAYVDTDTEFCLYVSVCLIKPLHEEINSRFLSLSMGMPYVKRQADSRIKGIGVPDLHLNQISEFDILCPPRDLQEQFIAFVEQTDKSKLAIQKGLEQLEMLKKALMQKFFEV